MKKIIAVLMSLIITITSIPLFGLVSLGADSIRTADDLKNLGSVYNLLGDKYIGDGGLRNVFIGVDGITAQFNPNSYSSSSYAYITSLKEYFLNEINAQSTNFGVGKEVEAKIAIKIVELNLKQKHNIDISKFNSSDNTDFESDSTEYAVFEYLHEIGTYEMWLDNYRQISRLWKTDEDGNFVILNSDFVDSLLNDDPEVFFANYGTHMITKYTAGGTATSSYYGKIHYDSNNENIVKNETESNSSEGVFTLRSSIEDIYQKSETTTNGSEVMTGGSKARGGSGNFAWDESSASAWANTIDKELAVTLIDDRLKMLPVWELLIDEEHTERKVQLEKYFYENVDSQYIDLYGKYIYSPTSNVDYNGYTFIKTAEDLYDIRNDLDGKFVLLNNIDISAYNNWDPIGTAMYPFTGTFDGNGNTVSGLNITESDIYAGLFGYNSGRIKNLTVSGNINTEASSDNNLAYVGSIAGYNAGTISNCRNLVTVSGNLNITKPVKSKHIGEKTWFDEHKNQIADAVESTEVNENTTINVGLAPVKIKGTKNDIVINVSGSADVTPAFIIFEDAEIEGTVIHNSSRDICIISKGNANKLTGTDGKLAFDAPNSNVYITGDADIELVGGKGSDGEGYNADTKKGNSGNIGKSAVDAVGLFVNLDADMTLQGGKGGTGATGEKGKDGKSYGEGSSAGGNGEVGIAGGDGGQGGFAVEAETDVHIYSGVVYFMSSCGGDGGKGGDGGNGGKGAWKVNNNGYPGGNGGTGGDGGNGGAGSLIQDESKIHIYNNSLIFIVDNAQLGNGGDAGWGGHGGTGGVGGSYWEWFAWHAKTGGKGGKGGTGGTGGDGYVGGKGGVGGCGGKGGDGGQAGGHPSNGGKGGDGGDSGDGGNSVNYGVQTVTSGGKAGVIGVPGLKGYKGPNGGSDGKSGDNYGASGEDGEAILKYLETPMVKYKNARKEYAVYLNPVNFAGVSDEQLVSIGSDDEQQRIDELIGLSRGTDYDYWLGADLVSYSKIDNKCIFEWQDGSKIKVTGTGENATASRIENSGNVICEAFVNFASGEPDHYDGLEYCVYQNADGKWVNSTDDKQCCYITEKTLSTVTTNTIYENALFVGGICGFNSGKIEKSYNSADISNCKASSSVSGVSAFAGGISSYSSGTTSDCVNDGDIQAAAVSASMSESADAYAHNIGYKTEKATEKNCSGYVVTDAIAVSANDLKNEVPDGVSAPEEDTAKAEIEQYWHNSKLEINKVSKSEYVRNTEFLFDSVDLSLNGVPVRDFKVNRNFYEIKTATVTVEYSDGINDYVRYVPVNITKEVPESIEIYTMPKTDYVVGDDFTTDGLSIKVRYNNNTEKLFPSSEVSVSTPGMDVVGTQAVTVSYSHDNIHKYECTYVINISSLETVGIQIDKYPDKLVYSQGELLNLNGLMVSRVYNNKETDPIPAELLKVEYDFTAVGVTDVTIRYGNFAATFECTVEQAENDSCASNGHNMCDWYVVKAADCFTAGSEQSDCQVCDFFAVRDIQALNHKNSHTDSGYDATCTEKGFTSGVFCVDCDMWISGHEEIASAGHNYEEVITGATLTQNGKTEIKCTACDDVSDEFIIYYPKTIKLSETSFTYNGKVQTPSVTVKDSKGNTLKKDTDYTVKYESGRKEPGRYTVKITFKGKYEGTKKLTYTIAPKATTKVTASQTTTTITLKWNKVTGADGYRVYKYNSRTKKWDTVKTTSATSLKVKDLKAGTKYKFKIKAYTKDDGAIWGKATGEIIAATKCNTPSITKLTTAKGTASLVWSNVSGESGYEVYASTKKDGSFRKVAATKANAVKATVSKLTSGKTYYFKVRAYKTVDGAKIYSSWSAVKSVKIK